MQAFRSVGTHWTASLFCLGILSARPASATSEEEKAGARAIADQGAEAFEAKKWAQALDLFTRAESLVHSPLHLLYKARALVQLGQLVKANETYLSIMREPVPRTASEAVNEAEEAAVKEQAALEPRLANLTVNLDGPGAADAIVTMDAAIVSPALVGVSRPVDPGQHMLQAAGPTSQSDIQTVTLKEGASVNVTLLLKAIPGAVAAAAPPATPLAVASVGSKPGIPGASKRTAAVVVGGAGVVALGVGGFFGLSAQSSYSDSKGLCSDSNICTKHGVDLRSSAKSKALVSTVATGVGVAGLATAVVLWFTAPKAEGPERRTSSTARRDRHWEVAPKRDAWGLEVAGAF